MTDSLGAPFGFMNIPRFWLCLSREPRKPPYGAPYFVSSAAAATLVRTSSTIPWLSSVAGRELLCNIVCVVPQVANTTSDQDSDCSDWSN